MLLLEVGADMNAKVWGLEKGEKWRGSSGIKQWPRKRCCICLKLEHGTWHASGCAWIYCAGSKQRVWDLHLSPRWRTACAWSRKNWTCLRWRNEKTCMMFSWFFLWTFLVDSKMLPSTGEMSEAMAHAEANNHFKLMDRLVRAQILSVIQEIASVHRFSLIHAWHKVNALFAGATGCQRAWPTPQLGCPKWGRTGNDWMCFFWNMMCFLGPPALRFVQGNSLATPGDSFRGRCHMCHRSHDERL